MLESLTKSIFVEDTFERDVLLTETEAMIPRVAEKLWSASRKESPTAHTVVVKLLTDIALRLRERVDLAPQQRYRLVGIGLSNFREPEDTARRPVLFE